MTQIPAATEIGTVELTVSSMHRSRRFYETTLGLPASDGDDGTVSFATAAATPLLRLTADAGAPPVDPRRPGLFHFALLLPSRRDLAAALLRLVRARWPLTGASDHLVSEALYLQDPDGNGIEIYRDRPPEEWPHDESGQLQMATLPLDLHGLLGELATDLPPEGREPDLPAGTRMGHVHLQVSELRRIETFYCDVLGFAPTVRDYPGALFVAAGGYHHHVGLNTWNSRGAEPPPADAVGLRHFEVRLPDEVAVTEVLDRLRVAEIPVDVRDDGFLARDPSGNRVLLTRRVP